MNKITSLIATASLAVMLVAGSSSGRAAEPVVGHLYTLDNDGDSNAVELQVSGDGKFLYLIGPIATQIAIFSLEAEDRVPQELPEGHSPFRLKTGQWTMGLALN
jgi:hypothetical protein